VNAANKLHYYHTMHAVNLEKVKLESIHQIMKYFKRMRSDLAGELARFDPTEPTRMSFKMKRAQKLFERAEQVIAEGYREIDKRMRPELKDAAAMEAEFSRQAINRAVGVEIASVALPASTMEKIVSDVMVLGAPSKEFWTREGVRLTNKFKDTIRMHLLRGDTLGKMLRSVRGTREMQFTDGILTASTREAASLIRTSMQTVANRSAEATYRENDDVVKGFVWLSTLDNRTTEICAVRDGLEYTLDMEPIGHSLPWLEGPGSVHYQCRSRSMPLLADYDGLPKAKQDAIRKAGKRSSMFGSVDRGTKFEPWLKEMDQKRPGFADEILGKQKAQLWRNSKLGLRDMVTGDGKPIPARVLKTKYASEWARAFKEEN